MRGFLGFIAFLLLLGLVAAVGVGIYNAGVSAGIASDIGSQISSGGQVPIVYPGPYVGQPWSDGPGFFGILFGIFLLFLFFGLIRAAFGWGHYRHYRDGGEGGGEYRSWGHHGGKPNDHLEAWHRESHEREAQAPKPDTA